MPFATVPDAILAQTVFTRNKNEAIFNHVLTLMQCDANTNSLKISLQASNFNSWSDLCDLTNAEIDAFKWTDATDNNRVKEVHLAYRGRLKAMISLYHDYSTIRNAHIDLETVTEELYNLYRVSTYDPHATRTPFHPTGQANPPAGGNTGGGTATGGGGLTEAEKFSRGVKKDIDHYREIRDEKQWDVFKRDTVATAKTHGTSNVLDPTYVPRGAD